MGELHPLMQMHSLVADPRPPVAEQQVGGCIMNGYQLPVNQCIVAIDEGGTGWIIARNDKDRETDVLPEVSAEDNGFNSGWDSGLSVGVYLVTFKAWAYQCYEGDWDAGVDVIKVEPLWQIPEMNYRLAAAS
ncbi:hypothetical protein EHS39_11650 [Ensifer sp. MPMI2T]|nr:hypothetical protein EHS39_11650 [Ensifer sp. MPMI2T]